MDKTVIAFLLIATGGPRYTQYLQPLIDSIHQNIPGNHVIVFSDDQPEDAPVLDMSYNVRYVHQSDLGWPRATLMRYHAMLKQQWLLGWYSHVFYMDIDMLVVSPIKEEEILSEGLTAVIHPGFPEAFERNPRSTAYVDNNPTYYQGCLIGGRTDKFLSMCQTIVKNIDQDDRNGLMAIWHDESHLNRYLRDNPPAVSLNPDYAFPERHYLKNPEKWMKVHPSHFVPKIRHLEKVDQGRWKNK
jgi:histo-blood group ABO system transferase